MPLLSRTLTSASPFTVQADGDAMRREAERLREELADVRRLLAGAISDNHECFLLLQQPGQQQAMAGLRLVTAEQRIASLTAELQQRDDCITELRRQQSERMTCKSCWQGDVVVLVPCGHAVLCSACAQLSKHCRLCRAAIEGSQRVFWS